MLRRNKTEVEPRVEWITNCAGLVEQQPIIPARKLMPEWLKQSEAKIPGDVARNRGFDPSRVNQAPPGPPRVSDSLPTIRHCPGVLDVMRMGYILRAWTDIEIVTERPAQQDGNDRHQSFTGMNPQETGGAMGAFGPALNQKLPLWPGEYDFAIKLDTPWVCKTPPGWSLLFMPMPYAEKTPFRVLHGLTDSDAFHVVNVITMWDHVGSYIIEAGTPICMLVPVRRDGFQMEADVSYDPERFKVLRALGKGAGGQGMRITHGSYVKERIRRKRQAEECPIKH